MNKRKEPNDPVYSRFLFFFFEGGGAGFGFSSFASRAHFVFLHLYTTSHFSALGASYSFLFERKERKEANNNNGSCGSFFFFLSSPFCASGSIWPFQQQQKRKTLVTAFSCLYSPTYSASMGVRTAVGEFALFVDRQAYVRVFDLRRTTFCFAVVANTTDKKKGDWSRASFFER